MVPDEYPATLGLPLISPESAYGLDHANYCPRGAQIFPWELVDDLITAYSTVPSVKSIASGALSRYHIGISIYSLVQVSGTIDGVGDNPAYTDEIANQTPATCRV